MGGETPCHTTAGNRHAPCRRHRRWAGSIPAWAGKPRSQDFRVRGNVVHRVYPRVGGETASSRRDRPVGSIPAWAGKPVGQLSCTTPRRSIPAWAGKPVIVHSAPSSRMTRVYPRVGGETSRRRFGNVRVDGVYPRVGGETRPGLNPAVLADRVYPRVGGETIHRGHDRRSVSAGLSPRGRGNPRRCEGRRCQGLSPRGRGNPLDAPRDRNLPGSIPAWAGKPPPACSTYPIEVYPRVGGETLLCTIAKTQFDMGLSPRGRGNPCVTISRSGGGSIPAWAGKPRPQPCSLCRHGSIPAWAGKPVESWHAMGLSPRGRGNLCVIMTQFRKRMNMSKIDGPTETHLPYGESGATRAARQVALDGAEPQ